MKPKTIGKWKLEFKGKSPDPAKADISIEYAYLIDENGEDAGVIAANAETWEDNGETKWTGNIEVVFMPSTSEEFDVVATGDFMIFPNGPIRNTKIAKNMIAVYASVAKDIEIESRETYRGQYDS